MTNKADVNQIISYRDMCNIEGQSQLQRGMNFNMGGTYSVILMSVKVNAPYSDSISEDGLTIYYEGHDSPGDKLKKVNQPLKYPGGSLTQNGLFVRAIEKGKATGSWPLVRVYEKLYPGVWNYRGLFQLQDYRYVNKGLRKVYEFELIITDQTVSYTGVSDRPLLLPELEQTRQIPGKVKVEVYKRDKGQCVKCGSQANLHFDHILPYSLGGTSLKTENIQLLCARHNLEKSASLEK